MVVEMGIKPARIEQTGCQLLGVVDEGLKLVNKSTNESSRRKYRSYLQHCSYGRVHQG
jgi:hypothetical protein